MHGIRRRLLPTTLGALCLAFVTVGCNKSQNTQGTTTTTPSSEASAPRSSSPSRSEIACHLHSCAPPKYCNRDTGICELLPCADSRDCPYGYKCDYAQNVCQ